MFEWFWNFIDELKFVFGEGRWELIVDGFLNTLKITAGALVVGIVIGILIAAVRSSFDKNKETMKLHGGAGYVILAILNAISKVYLTVIRGTPVVVQLMICYFVVFVSADDGVPVAIFAFGINSGAYVAEIFRAALHIY